MSKSCSKIPKMKPIENLDQPKPYLFTERKLIIYFVCVLTTGAIVLGIVGTAGDLQLKARENGVRDTEFTEFKKFIIHLRKTLLYCAPVHLSGYFAVSFDSLPLARLHLVLSVLQNLFVLTRLLKCTTHSLDQMMLLLDYLGDLLHFPNAESLLQIHLNVAFYFLILFLMALYDGLVVWYILDLKFIRRNRFEVIDL